MFFEFGIKDVIDILLVALMLYYIYRLMRDSRSLNVFIGIMMFAALWLFVSQILEMRLLGTIMDKLVSVGVIAMIVIFQEDIRKFLRGMRKDCKDRGIELKYIHVPEIGEKGARHHHLVITKVDTDIISKNWKWGFFGVRPLDSSRNWRRLAAYLLKYSCKAIGTEFELSGKRWNASRRAWTTCGCA